MRDADSAMVKSQGSFPRPISFLHDYSGFNRTFRLGSLNSDIIVGFVLLVFVFITGCGGGGTGSSQNATGTTIQGTVTSASEVSFKTGLFAQKTIPDGNVAVPGAVCMLDGTDKNTTTDQNGFFKITNVPPGTYILICKKRATDGNVYAFLKIVDAQEGETTDIEILEITEAGKVQGRAALADQSDHTGITVFIPGTSFQAKTDAIGAYLITDIPVGTYPLHFEKGGYVTGRLANIAVTPGQTAAADDMTLNISTGATGSISIEGGKNYSGSREVILSITSSKNAVLMMIGEEPNFLGAVWQDSAETITWAFSSDGEKRLYAKFADANGLESAPVSDSIIIDTTPPINGRVTINNGASSTNSRIVILSAFATDAMTSVTQIKISNDPTLVEATWETVANARSWSLSAGEGIKTVYIKFKDRVGNETAEIASASILLDTLQPTNPSMTIQEGAYTNTHLIHLSLSASDATFYKISEDPQFTDASLLPFTSATSWTLSAGEGIKTIYVSYLDDAGNQSAPVSAAIIVDTVSPTAAVIFNQNQATKHATFTMTLSAPSTDANFKTYQLRGGQYSDWTDTSELSSFNFTLTQQGPNLLSVRGIDAVGNIGTDASIVITLDTTGPVLSAITVLTTMTGAAISWQTSEPASSSVEFGLNEDYGSTQPNPSFTTSHVVLIPGLQSQALYHYKITATDTAGNATASSDLTFTTLSKMVTIATGGYHTCGLTAQGGVKCWGYNTYGQVGNGSTTERILTPVDVVGLSSGVTGISAGLFHTCALTTSGGTKCWGRNNWDGLRSENGDQIGGQLGDGTVTNRSIPVDVQGLSAGVFAIAAGGFHTCALTTSGVKCWGQDDNLHLVPSNVPGLSGGIWGITSGGFHSCVLMNTGGVKCWGSNNWGQIGPLENGIGPADIPGLGERVVSFEAGFRHTCAVTASGGVKCWGYNDLNQLGDGTRTTRPIAVSVTNLSSGIVATTGGGDHTCALTSTGGVKCWGYNLYGQLGDGSSSGARPTPLDVVGLSSSAVTIEAGEGHTCAITNSGGIKCWGDNSWGQLGDGTVANRSTPVDVLF